ncbi:hypothetical protein AgCh_003947 [Apium graveolens]
MTNVENISTLSSPISESSSLPAATSHLPPVQVHHLISVKLDNTNYLLWLTRFQPLLIGYELEGYVDGSLPCPPRNLPESNEINPTYTNWKKQDQSLLGWLLSSLTESVLAQVVGLTTSRQVWESIKRHFSSQSQARIIQLKRELQNMRKGNKTMAEYYLHAKRLTDSLAASGQPISSTDLQHMMMSGLDSSYDPIVTVLTASVAPLHMDDFYSNLLAYEMRLESQITNFPQPMANLAQRGHSRSNNNNHVHRDGNQLQC